MSEIIRPRKVIKISSHMTCPETQQMAEYNTMIRKITILLCIKFLAHALIEGQYATRLTSDLRMSEFLCSVSAAWPQHPAPDALSGSCCPGLSPTELLQTALFQGLARWALWWTWLTPAHPLQNASQLCRYCCACRVWLLHFNICTRCYFPWVQVHVGRSSLFPQSLAFSNTSICDDSAKHDYNF